VENTVPVKNPQVFEKKNKDQEKMKNDYEEKLENLYAEVGKLTTQLSLILVS